MSILSAGLRDVEDNEQIKSVDIVTRIVAEKYCESLQQEDDQDLHDDDRMSNEFIEGYDGAIQAIRKEAGLEPLEIDYKNNKIIEKKKKPVKTLSKKTTRKPEVFTVSDEKIFTVKSSDIKTLGEVIGEKYKSELIKTFVCDKCRTHIIGNNIELKPFGNNFNMFNPMVSISLVDATDRVIIGTSNTHLLNKDHDYYTFSCPSCHQVHLFGMTPIDPRQVFEVK